VQAKLSDLEWYSFNPEAIALLRQRLEANLAGSTHEDKRFILEAVGTKVIAQADGSWELELQVPCQPIVQDKGFQIVNSRPGLNSPKIPI
jgi:hypothetical protein